MNLLLVFQCNFGIPQNWLIWVWLPPELSASTFISYNLSFSKCLEKHLPVLYPCTVCCSRFPGFCLIQRHIKKDNNNKIYQKELFSRDVEYKQFIRTLLKLPGVDQSPKSIVFSQFWYGIFLPWCWSVTEELCSFEYFRAKNFCKSSTKWLLLQNTYFVYICSQIDNQALMSPCFLLHWANISTAGKDDHHFA